MSKICRGKRLDEGELEECANHGRRRNPNPLTTHPGSGLLIDEKLTVTRKGDQVRSSVDEGQGKGPRSAWGLSDELSVTELRISPDKAPIGFILEMEAWSDPDPVKKPTTPATNSRRMARRLL